jgi:hypothetical protein
MPQHCGSCGVGFYNPARRHSGTGYLSPIAHEAQVIMGDLSDTAVHRTGQLQPRFGVDFSYGTCNSVLGSAGVATSRQSDWPAGSPFVFVARV